MTQLLNFLIETMVPYMLSRLIYNKRKRDALAKLKKKKFVPLQRHRQNDSSSSPLLDTAVAVTETTALEAQQLALDLSLHFRHHFDDYELYTGGSDDEDGANDADGDGGGLGSLGSSLEGKRDTEDIAFTTVCAVPNCGTLLLLSATVCFYFY